jgi:ubiquinone/menaquinone biosynthesis C-methylase UbiE
MNYGYHPLRESEKLPLEPEDESNRLCIQLYSYILQEIDMNGKRVLEVGSGRGGGADFIARTKNPARLIGLDYSSKAITLSQSFYDHPALSFVTGNSENLPFEPESFDIVYNIESSHCYGDMSAFISEVERVLKPGGYFCWADLRTPKDLDKDEELFESSSLTIVLKEEITPNVVKALELASETKEQAIQSHAPSFILGAFKEFAGIKDTKVFRAFQEGSLEYWHYRMQKPLH